MYMYVYTHKYKDKDNIQNNLLSLWLFVQLFLHKVEDDSLLFVTEFHE